MTVEKESFKKTECRKYEDAMSDNNREFAILMTVYGNKLKWDEYI